MTPIMDTSGGGGNVLSGSVSVNNVWDPSTGTWQYGYNGAGTGLGTGTPGVPGSAPSILSPFDTSPTWSPSGPGVANTGDYTSGGSSSGGNSWSGSQGSVGGFGTGSFGTSSGTSLSSGLSYSPLTGYSYGGQPINIGANGVPTYASSGQPVYPLIAQQTQSGSPNTPVSGSPYGTGGLTPMTPSTGVNTGGGPFQLGTNLSSSGSYQYNQLTGSYDFVPSTPPGTSSSSTSWGGQPPPGTSSSSTSWGGQPPPYQTQVGIPGLQNQIPQLDQNGQPIPQTYPAPIGSQISGGQPPPSGGGQIPPIDYLIMNQIAQQTGMPITQVALSGGGGGPSRALSLNLPPNIPPQAIFPPAIPQSWANVTAPNQNAQPAQSNFNMPGPQQGGGSYGNGGNPLQNGPEVIGQFGATPPGEESPLSMFLPGIGNVEMPRPQLPIAGIPHQNVPGAVPGMSVPQGAMAVTANALDQPGEARGGYGYTTSDSGAFNFPPPQGRLDPAVERLPYGYQRPAPENLPEKYPIGQEPDRRLTPLVDKMGSAKFMPEATPMEQLGMRNLQSKIKGAKYENAMQPGIDAMQAAADRLDEDDKRILAEHNEKVRQLDNSLQARHSSKEVKDIQKSLMGLEKDMKGIEEELGVNQDGSPRLKLDNFIPPRVKQMGAGIRQVQEWVYAHGGDPNDMGQITKEIAMRDVRKRMSPFEQQQMWDHIGRGRGLKGLIQGEHMMPGHATRDQLDRYDQRVAERQRELLGEIAGYNSSIQQAHQDLADYRKQRMEDYNILKDAHKEQMEKLKQEYKIDDDYVKRKQDDYDNELAKALSAEGRKARMNAMAAKEAVMTSKYLNDYEQKERKENRMQMQAGEAARHNSATEQQAANNFEQRGKIAADRSVQRDRALGQGDRRLDLAESAEEGPGGKRELRRAMTDQAYAYPMLKQQAEQNRQADRIRKFGMANDKFQNQKDEQEYKHNRDTINDISKVAGQAFDRANKEQQMNQQAEREFYQMVDKHPYAEKQLREAFQRAHGYAPPEFTRSTSKDLATIPSEPYNNFAVKPLDRPPVSGQIPPPPGSNGMMKDPVTGRMWAHNPQTGWNPYMVPWAQGEVLPYAFRNAAEQKKVDAYARSQSKPKKEEAKAKPSFTIE